LDADVFARSSHIKLPLLKSGDSFALLKTNLFVPILPPRIVVRLSNLKTCFYNNFVLLSAKNSLPLGTLKLQDSSHSHVPSPGQTILLPFKNSRLLLRLLQKEISRFTRIASITRFCAPSLLTFASLFLIFSTIFLIKVFFQLPGGTRFLSSSPRLTARASYRIAFLSSQNLRETSLPQTSVDDRISIHPP